MTIQIDDLGCVDGGRSWCQIVRSAVAIAFAAAAALLASVTNAGASATETNSAWSYGFADSLWTNNELERRRMLSPAVADWALRCFVNCGPAFGAYVVRRSELLTSNNADVSGKKIVDVTGHAIGVSGTIVIERLERDGFGADSGSPADWVVVGERTLDGNETHSWALSSSGISLDAPWFPSDLYRFEGSSVSIDLATGTTAGAAPEPSTWAMILIGFAGLGLAGSRSSRSNRRSIHFPNRICAMMYSLRQRRSARSGSTPAPFGTRGSNIPENRDGQMESTRDAADELAVKLPILEAEVLGLRQLLAEVRADRDKLRQEIDDLRSDRDHWQRLAEQAEPTLSGAARRTWFCGRASAGH
jgi:hypothetical protein